ncbi:putative secreted glycoprotein [Haloferax gibbonsii]|uniref:Secreted glycoprotein n=1 Tax=Haloferax gibbonsii TaxID=35746 RepID=A0A871BJF2_HALGI|nr:PGF-pre-PGF domain-containing protein [Haloferax gibbonsii]QOS12854.1 putative secreted glycoprotein [Haloferax gibbonsii]
MSRLAFARRVVVAAVVCAVVLAGVAPFAAVSAAGAASSATVSVAGVDSVGLEETATATLRAADVPAGAGVGAFAVNVTYDPSVVSVRVADSDFAVETAAPESGVLRIVGYTDARSGPTGDVALAALDVTGESAGDATLGVEVDTLADADGSAITRTTADASVEVTGGSDGGETDGGDTTDSPDDPGGESDDDTGGSSGGSNSGGARTSVRTSASNGGLAVDIRNAKPGAPVEVDLSGVERGGVRVDGLSLTLGAKSDAKLTVRALDSVPDGTPALDGGPLSYLDVAHDVDDSAISGVNFTVSVSKATLTDRGLDPADLRLYRYSDGEWRALSTGVAGETDDEVRFTAVSPGLSVFALAPAPAGAAFAVTTGPLPSSVVVGDSVTVTATVENTGQTRGETTVDLTVDGAVSESRTLDLAPGETRTVEFVVAADAVGRYDVAVDGVSAGTLRVDAESTPTPTATTESEPATTGTSTPGFGAVTAALAAALAALVALARRRT